MQVCVLDWDIKQQGDCLWDKVHNLETMDGEKALIVYTKSVIIKLIGTASLYFLFVFFLHCPYSLPVAHLFDAVMFSCKLMGIV